MSEAIGIMDPAYFVNKNDILKWVNTTLKLNIEKIDHLGTGAVYCQFLDMIYPGSVCMGKVNWKAKLEYEHLSNFKVVTNCLEKNDVKKHIDVNKLVKCKYQDNLEFAQWFKKFYDTKCGDRNSDYDPEARRAVKISSVVDVPKVARKAEQAVQKTISSSIVAPNTSKDTTSKDKKPVLPQKPAISNNKRTIGQLYEGKTASNVKVPNKMTPKSSNNNNSNKEYNSLVNSIKDILKQGESETEIVNKIRSLVNVEKIQLEEVNNNGQSNQQQEKENGGLSSSQIKQNGEQQIFKDATNTLIEQEN